MWRQGSLVLPVVLLMSLGYSGACSVGDIKLDCEDPSLCDEDGNPLPVQYAARGVDVVEVALYQTVKVPLMENGTAQNSSVGVVGDKDALIRVFVEPHAAFSSRTIVARLTLDTGAEAPVIYEESYAVTGTSSESSLSSTINFNVMGADLPPGTTWALELLESEMDFEGSEDLGRDHWPEEGSDALLPENMGGALKIQILPVRYNADGSGRLPDTTSSRIRQFEEKMSAMYPASTVEIEVLNALPWSQQVHPYGTGWSQLLQQVYYERVKQGTPYDTYVYGLFNPASSLGQYCSSGCVLGLSTLATSPGDDWARISIGLGFAGDTAIETYLHEVGHAHGREHAPCGTSDYDRSFPYSSGSLGSWGYDASEGDLKSPNAFKDIMSYCEPSWVSDYTYNALFDRIQAVNGASEIQWPQDVPREWSTVFIHTDGTMSWGEGIELVVPPSGREEVVQLLDDQGHVLREVAGRYAPFDHLDGGVLLVPESVQNVNRLRVRGAVLTR